MPAPKATMTVRIRRQGQGPRQGITETLIQDFRFGAKLLWNNKGFAITVIATLAICVGANAGG